MVRLAQLATELSDARTASAAEKSKNDASELPPGNWPEPIYPETSGSFQFVQILSQYDGTSIFRASDGLFVLLLSPGDSFSAYPGQSVQMTMHTRGETMSLTIGQAAVFRSGSSPVTTRHFDGFSPDRRDENRLHSRVEELEDRFREASDELRGPHYAKLEARLDPSSFPTRLLVSDRSGYVYCITDSSPEVDCPIEAIEHLTLADLRAGITGSTAIVRASQGPSGSPVIVSPPPTLPGVTSKAPASTQPPSPVTPTINNPINANPPHSDATQANGGTGIRPIAHPKKSHPLEGCEDIKGNWTLTTTVKRAKSPSAVGVNGFYELEVEADCAVTLAKTGFSGPGGRMFEPGRFQRGRGTLQFASGSDSTINIDLSRDSAVEISMSLILWFEDSEVRGQWKHIGASYDTTGFEGVVTGLRSLGRRPHEGPPASARNERDISRDAIATASSTLPPDLDMTFEPGNLLDGSLDWSWQPNAKARRGVGEWFRLTFPAPRTITRLEVANGFQSIWRGQDLFGMNARLQEVEISLGARRIRHKFDQDSRGFTEIFVDPPATTENITLEVISVHRGTRWPDVVVSEVRVFGLEDPLRDAD